MNNLKIAVGTRYWGKAPEEIGVLKNFISQATQISGLVFAAINVAEDKSQAIENPIAGADIFPVTPWQKFVPALNAIVFRAVQDRKPHSRS